MFCLYNLNKMAAVLMSHVTSSSRSDAPMFKIHRAPCRHATFPLLTLSHGLTNAARRPARRPPGGPISSGPEGIKRGIGPINKRIGLLSDALPLRHENE